MTASVTLRSLLLTTILVTLFSVCALASANETTLFDSRGNAVAYIVERSGTIFLFSGTPVAYLHQKSFGADFAIFGFNGQHLGWFDDGIVRDSDGYAVGFRRGAVSNVIPRVEPIKRVKRIEPVRRPRRLEPLQPFFRSSFSRVPLEEFLYLGIR